MLTTCQDEYAPHVPEADWTGLPLTEEQEGEIMVRQL